MGQLRTKTVEPDGFVPVIDIASYFSGRTEAKHRVAEQVGRACRDVGFYVIVGHGVDPKLVEQVDIVSREFFDLPLEEKMRLHVGKEPGAAGYAAIGDTALAYTRGQVAPPDLNESFQVAKVDAGEDAYFQSEAARGLVPRNRWPERPAALKDLYVAYYLRMGQLAAELMRLSALALDLPESYFDDKIDRHISRLNVRLYPEQKVAPLPGQLRAAAHTDYGTVTILRPGDTVGGLQVADRNGNWHDVPSIAGSFVINQGDLMARWTNDRWLSTLHRVANPPEEAKGGSRRLSIVFFHHPNYDATVSCLPTCLEPGRAPTYEPIRVSDYYSMKRAQQRAARAKALAPATA
ncbi:MAG TPA: 2-oxoglutarate and iron-dependent oxygenase domain-containing protein [Xanthobacteraceae bacterium]